MENNLYVPKFNPGAQEALEKGTLRIKVDGQCGAIVKIDGKLMLATRYDDQKGKVHLGVGMKTGFVEMPEGKNPSTFQKHHYAFELWPRPPAEAKGKQLKLRLRLYDILDTIESDRLVGNFTSVEYVGKKFQQTPGYELDILLHHELPIQTVERTWEAIKSFVCEKPIEGLVVEYQGKYWKIRQNCFTKSGSYDALKKQK